jgi:hypothetical protein
VYTYDAIGSYERTGYSCQGSGKDLMQPVLDNQLKAASPLLLPARVRGGAAGAGSAAAQPFSRTYFLNSTNNPAHPRPAPAHPRTL